MKFKQFLPAFALLVGFATVKQMEHWNNTRKPDYDAKIWATINHYNDSLEMAEPVQVVQFRDVDDQSSPLYGQFGENNVTSPPAYGTAKPDPTMVAGLK